MKQTTALYVLAYSIHTVSLYKVPASYIYTVQFDFHISGYFVYLCTGQVKMSSDKRESTAHKNMADDLYLHTFNLCAQVEEGL